MPVDNLAKSRTTKNDEFYTPYQVVSEEVGNYLLENKNLFDGKNVLCPCDDPQWSQFTHYFVKNFLPLHLNSFISSAISLDNNRRGTILKITRPDDNIIDFVWEKLDDSGEYRSREITEYKNGSDFVITNPPFTLFGDFLQWVLEGGDRGFSVIGNANSLTYGNVFPHLFSGKMWLGGYSIEHNGAIQYYTPSSSDDTKIGDTAVFSYFYTNLPHRLRYIEKQYDTLAQNLANSKHEQIRKHGYLKYDNYDAIEVPFIDAIPSDYEGVMGVPITFITKLNPLKFELLGLTTYAFRDTPLRIKTYKGLQLKHTTGGKILKVNDMNTAPVIKLTEKPENKTFYEHEGQYYRLVYARLLIRNRIHG